MIIIVGLGNPGEKYDTTRHNVGFMVVDLLAKKMGRVGVSDWQEERKMQALTARRGEVLLVKPTTYMNESGLAVAKLLNFYKVDPMALFVIHDEIDLPLGKIKIVSDRGAAGHHGVESIIKELGGKNFIRVRVGVGQGGYQAETGFKGKTRATVRYVLGKFVRNEEGKLNQVIKKTVEATEMIIKHGVEKAMGKYN